MRYLRGRPGILGFPGAFGIGLSRWVGRGQLRRRNHVLWEGRTRH